MDSKSLLRAFTMTTVALCLSCPISRPQPCRSHEVEFTGTYCPPGGGDCRFIEDSCVSPCTDDDDCALGYDCVWLSDDSSSRWCSPLCNDASCNRDKGEGERHDRECDTSGGCRAVECGRYVQCDGAMICDPNVRKCYPENGACSASADDPCPEFEVLEPVCEDGWCQVNSDRTGTVSGLEVESDMRIEVEQPATGSTFSSYEEVTLDWVAVDGDVILLVFADEPENADDLREMAIWGRSLSRGAQRSVSLADGHSIVDGEWLPFDEETIPTRRPLYLLVQSVDRGRLLAISDLIPFRIEDAWPGHDAECDADDFGDINGQSCRNPAAVQVCVQEWEDGEYVNRCRVVCLSQADCRHLCTEDDNCADRYVCQQPRDDVGLPTCEPTSR